MRYISPLDYILVFVGTINMIRIAFLLIGSDLYAVKNHFRKPKKIKGKYEPSISVIIPAHNEERTILRAVRSVFSNNYPKNKLEVIVVDDGSQDTTYRKVKFIKDFYEIDNLQVVRQENSGKANALNNGIINYSKGKLIMCLDADSALAPNAIEKAVQKFRNPKVKGISANVKIIPDGTLFNLIQKIEYIVCYQMKRAQTYYNIEYIIGGIGSVFRKSTLKRVGYYDTNTVTEDIDLTMKILQLGNKSNRVIYGHDVVAYTESCLTMSALIRQRYRWKWGRSQTFYKNLKMFFNTDKKYTKGLTSIYLPFAIFLDITFFLEPILVSYMIFITIFYKDPLTLISAIVVLTTYVSINILAEDTLTIKQRLMHIVFAPFMYFFFFILTFAEYMALIKSTTKLHSLSASVKGETPSTWQHVERAGQYLN